MGKIYPILSGLLFGAGLAISGMMDPRRVIGFLDVTGAWDPTLAFVMGGALLVMAIAWMIQKRMQSSLASDEFDLPDTSKVDARLISGSALFGIGWGIAGLCPGPAIASLSTALWPALTFVGAMFAGMMLFRLTLGRS